MDQCSECTSNDIPLLCVSSDYFSVDVLRGVREQLNAVVVTSAIYYRTSSNQEVMERRDENMKEVDPREETLNYTKLSLHQVIY